MKNKMVHIFPILFFCLLLVGNLNAKILKTGEGYTYSYLQDALSASASGDSILIYPGNYKGNFLINKSLVIIGKGDPVIDGNYQGTVLTVEAPNVIIEGVIIQNSGKLLDREDAGILVKADNVLIQNNIIRSVLFGVYFKQANKGFLRNNLIEGKQELDIPRRGDLFRAWYSNDLVIENNELKYGRDIIIWFSHRTVIKGNKVSGARYGLHFMYSGNCRILNNRVTYSSVGMYLMYSKNLKVEKNLLAYNRGASGFGIGLKDLDNVLLKENVIADNRVGIFIDNSPRNFDAYMKYTGNIIAYNETGIDVLSSLENSYFKKNSLIENYQQASLTRSQNPDNDYWEENYWSNYSGFDKDRDGLGDIPFREDQVFEDLIENKPNLKIFLYSPAVNTLNYAANAFPILKPQPVLIDKTPLISPDLPSGLPSVKIDRNFAFMTFALALTILSGALMVLFIFRNSIVRQKMKKSIHWRTDD